MACKKRGERDVARVYVQRHWESARIDGKHVTQVNSRQSMHTFV